jgi:hypothetical protein
MPSTDCGLSPGDVIVVDPESRERLRDCAIPEGVIFRIFYKEERPMEPVEQEVPVIEQAPTPVNDEGSRAVVVAEPAQEPPVDLTQIAQATGGDPTLTLALGLLAVVGGAAGWKFWTQFSAQKHEQKMRAMDIEAQQAGLAGAQPPPCQVKQVEVNKRLDSLDKRQADLARKMNVLSKFDASSLDDLEKRVVKLEKAALRTRGQAP